MNGKEIVEYILRDTLVWDKFLGVFAKDRLPLPTADTFCICNTDVWESVGKHWIVVYFPHNGFVEYFDPLGEKPSSHFKSFMKPNFIYNTHRYQAYASLNCAYYCIFFVYMRCHGIPFQNVLSLIGSDKNVVRFVKML